MSWWGKIQRSLNIRDPKAVKKTLLRATNKYSKVGRDQADVLSKELSQRGTQLSKQASDYGSRATNQLKRSATDYGSRATNQLKRSASDYGRRFKDVPESLRKRSVELGREAQKQAYKRTAEVQRQTIGAARALPAKAAEAAKDAAAAGTRAAKTAAQAGTQAAAGAGKRVAERASNAIPGVKSYAQWAGRRVVFVLFGTAFLYGLGTSLPGTVGRYLAERKERRRELEQEGD